MISYYTCGVSVFYILSLLCLSIIIIFIVIQKSKVNFTIQPTIQPSTIQTTIQQLVNPISYEQSLKLESDYEFDPDNLYSLKPGQIYIPTSQSGFLLSTNVPVSSNVIFEKNI